MRDAVSRRSATLGLMGLMALVGCGRSEAGTNSEHPNTAAVLGADADDRRIDLGAQEGKEEGANRRDWLASLSRVVAVGALDRPPEQVFGQITDVAVNERQVFVLDGRLNRVVIFDRTGELFQVVGRSGQGPGEFVQPHSLLLLHDQRLLVGDAVGKLHRFIPDASGRYAFDSSMAIAVSPESMCELSGRVYVHGLDMPPTALVYVYSHDGEQLASFGGAYHSGEPMVDMQFSTGRVACVPRTGMVYFASDALFGEVRAFDAGGAQLWRTWLPEFAPPRVAVSEEGLTVELPPGGFDRLAGLTILDDTLVVLQVARVVPEKATEAVGGTVVRLTSVFIPPPGTGAVRHSTALPRIGEVAGQEIVLLWDDPFPRLELKSTPRIPGP